MPAEDRQEDFEPTLALMENQKPEGGSRGIPLHSLGDTIGPFQLVDFLGRGGMGIVYRAQDDRLDRTVALKFLPAEWSEEPVLRERFSREARAASALDHPNICTIFDIGETPDGQLFIAINGH